LYPFRQQDRYRSFFLLLKWPYESGCQGHITPSQGTGSFLGPRHPATVRYLYPADPAALFGITHALAFGI
jgi:hypothetical protein